MTTNIEWCKNADGSKGETWNVLTGCDHKSDGCDNCWAARMATRQIGMGNKNYRGSVKGGKWTGKIRLLPDALEKPLHWKKPRTIFVQSMGDLFHTGVPFEFIDKVFAVMGMADILKHQFMILTKRPERMYEYLNTPDRDLEILATANVMAKTPNDAFLAHVNLICANKCRAKHWPLPNVHLYTSIEDQATADERIPWLLKTPAVVRGISLEPMLGPVDLDGYLPGERSCIKCNYVGDGWGEERCVECGEDYPPPTENEEPLCKCGSDEYELSCPRCGSFDAFGPYGSEGRYDTPATLDHVIVGGESGPGARPMPHQWVRDVRDQCVAAGVPFFLKQMEVNGKLTKMPQLAGRTWDEMPGQEEG